MGCLQDNRDRYRHRYEVNVQILLLYTDIDPILYTLIIGHIYTETVGN